MGLFSGGTVLAVGCLVGGGSELGLGDVDVDLWGLSGVLSLGCVEGEVGLEVSGGRVVLLIHIK